MQCPKCGADVNVGAAECPSCGVILSKAMDARPVQLPPAAQPQTKPPATPLVIKLAIAIAGVWFIFHLLAPKSGTLSAGGWYEGAGGYEKALSEQKTNGKSVMVYFHTAWCGYCKRLDHDVFSTAEFRQRYGDALLKVQINPETGHAENSIAHQYNVRGYPTVYIVTAGRTSEPIVGFGGADGFYARLADAMRN